MGGEWNHGRQSWEAKSSPNAGRKIATSLNPPRYIIDENGGRWTFLDSDYPSQNSTNSPRNSRKLVRIIPVTHGGAIQTQPSFHPTPGSAELEPSGRVAVQPSIPSDQQRGLEERQVVGSSLTQTKSEETKSEETRKEIYQRFASNQQEKPFPPSIPSHWNNSARKEAVNDTSNDLAIARALLEEDLKSGYGGIHRGEIQTPVEASGTGFSEAVGRKQAAEDHDLAVALTAAELGLGVRGKKLADVEQEVKERLSKLNSFPHEMRVNSDSLPTEDAFTRNRRILAERLAKDGLRENEMAGDGNCQFRAISDQLFGTPERHRDVRLCVVHQLRTFSKMYKSHVPEDFYSYLSKMEKNAEWGDHVTLQAAADFYCVKIYLITSYEDRYVVEILPQDIKPLRVICLSFWAEVHYNSVYAVEAE